MGKRILEIGSGTGYQLKKLKKLSERAVGVEVSSSSYRENRVADIIEYDGATLPFKDKSFDIIFSSNTLEHIRDLDTYHKECLRVLIDDGFAVHILPTHTWRLLTSLVHYTALPITIRNYVRKRRMNTENNGSVQHLSRSGKSNAMGLLFNVLFFSRHGERGNRFTEALYFHPKWFVGNFTRNGWRVLNHYPAGLVYSGHLLLRNIVSMNRRKWLAGIFGSSCEIFILAKDRGL